MEKYYKILKSDADKLTKFTYEKDMAFDPYVGEQVDGTYIVREEVYKMLKNHDNFKKVDWNSKVKIDKSELNPK